MTGGDFDITVGPLVKAWGFGPDSRKSISDSKRDSLLQFVGMEKVEVKGKRIIKDNPGVVLDFNAIAQGYSVDVICEYFDSKGFRNYLVEIGGEVRVKGDKTGDGWKIGIDRPTDDNMTPGADLQAVVTLKDRSLATSGNYRKFYVENGVKYSHTIDPHTGYPAKNTLLSATKLASDCATADAIATACMVKGIEKSIDFIKLHPEFDAYFIYSGENGEYLTWATEGIKSSIEINK
jgi:thiamine biosynthesis lipoprotein